MSIDQEAVSGLRSRLAGGAFLPADDGYAGARAIWNGMVARQPAVIVTCKRNEDVVAAVGFAREQGLGVSVRGGGHHVAGSSLIEGGLVIDLSEMRGVTVDAGRAIARAEGGAQIADLDRATQAHALAVPMGVVSETGVAGLTLAGGIGWLRRKHGMSCDNLIGADVVLADGSLVRASATEHADLLWALRGGGWDLGAVVALEYQAYPLGPDVWVSVVGYPWAEVKEVARNFRAFAATAPEGFNALFVFWTVPELDEFPRESWGQPFVLIVGPYAGSVDEGRRATEPLLSLGTVLGDASGEMPFVEAQRVLFDEDYPKGDRYYWRSTYLRDLPDEALDILMDHTLKRPSPRSSLDVWQLGGAIGRTGSDSAAGQREAPWLIGIEANWSDPAQDAANVAWAREAGERLRPFSTGGSYMNFEDPDDARATAAAYGDSLSRLKAIKQKYDPDNLFRSRRGLAG
jgi:FAD/FMN-containing dehydrogenase